LILPLIEEIRADGIILTKLNLQYFNSSCKRRNSAKLISGPDFKEKPGIIGPRTGEKNMINVTSNSFNKSKVRTISNSRTETEIGMDQAEPLMQTIKSSNIKGNKMRGSPGKTKKIRTNRKDSKIFGKNRSTRFKRRI